MSEPGGEAMERRAGEILQAQDAVRARLPPTGKDLERLLMRLHRQSAKAQQNARKSHAKLREELHRRLEEGETLVIHGNEVVVEKVTTRELIGAMEADTIRANRRQGPSPRKCYNDDPDRGGAPDVERP